MSEAELALQQFISEKRVAGRSPHNLRVYATFLAAVLLYFGTVCFVYPAVFLDFDSLFGLPREQLAHILINGTANTAVVIAAFGLSGRMNHRVKKIIAFALLLHIAIALGLFFGRFYYSRSIVFSSLLISMLSGTGVVVLMQVALPTRIALLGRTIAPEIVQWLPKRTEFVLDPSADLRDYGLVLVDFQSELSQPWIASISRTILAGVDVYHIADYVERAKGRVSVDHFATDQLKAHNSHRVFAATKRAFDIVTVLVITPLVLLLLGGACLAVAISMGRPVFFTQDRTGLGGRTFRMHKLRTMKLRTGNERPNATAVNDDRITPLGKILRRFRIDELPQMWNVLRGEMSLIGPRPEQPVLSAKYAAEMPVYTYRHLVRPGISGWAQTWFGYAADSAETRQKLSYDLYYVKYQSWYLDTLIALRTIKTLIGGTAVR